MILLFILFRCPTCRKTVLDPRKVFVTEGVSDTQLQLSNVAEAMYESLSNENQRMKRNLEKCMKKLKEAEAMYESLTNENQRMKRKLEELVKKSKESHKKYESMCRKYSDLKKRHDQKENEWESGLFGMVKENCGAEMSIRMTRRSVKNTQTDSKEEVTQLKRPPNKSPKELRSAKEKSREQQKRTTRKRPRESDGKAPRRKRFRECRKHVESYKE